MATALYLASLRDLPDPAVDASLLPLVSPARQEKIARLRLPAARRRALGAGLLLRRVLSDAGEELPPIAFGPQGKPYFPDRPDLQFSLSHSADAALCALSDSSVGCDVEILGPARPELAERFFHPSERRWLSALPPSEYDEAFFRLWTLKESYLKATGLGLSGGLESFCVDLGGGVPRLWETPDAERWWLFSVLDGSCVCGLCHSGETSPILRRVDLLP